MDNKVLRELVKFCYEERISITKFSISTSGTKANGVNYFGETCKLIYRGKWEIK